jgi:hypothetical protein
LRDRFTSVQTPVRGIIEVRLDRIQESCGWGVPLYAYEGERSRLVDYNAKRTQAEFMERRYATNSESIDGLPGLSRP